GVDYFELVPMRKGQNLHGSLTPMRNGHPARVRVRCTSIEDPSRWRSRTDIEETLLANVARLHYPRDRQAFQHLCREVADDAVLSTNGNVAVYAAAQHYSSNGDARARRADRRIGKSTNGVQGRIAVRKTRSAPREDLLEVNSQLRCVATNDGSCE